MSNTQTPKSARDQKLRGVQHFHGRMVQRKGGAQTYVDEHWRAQISTLNHSFYIGCFKTAREAAYAYDEVAIRVPLPPKPGQPSSLGYGIRRLNFPARFKCPLDSLPDPDARTKGVLDNIYEFRVKREMGEKRQVIPRAARKAPEPNYFKQAMEMEIPPEAEKAYRVTYAAGVAALAGRIPTPEDVDRIRTAALNAMNAIRAGTPGPATEAPPETPSENPQNPG